MHVGRLHFRLAERHRDAVLARFDAAACYAGLRELAASLDGHPWMVVSGLVEPLVGGRFSRPHSDIDIAVPVAGLRAMAEAVLRRGYAMTTRVLRTHVSADADIEAHLRIEPWMLPTRCRHLRLWRLDRNGEFDERTFPAYVDVFPYDLVDDRMHILDSGQRLPLRGALSIPVPLPGGPSVPVENPCYVEALRESRRRARSGEVALPPAPSRSAAAPSLEP
jgi:hypothetical protein